MIAKVHYLNHAIEQDMLSKLRAVANALPQGESSSNTMGLYLFQNDRKTLIELVLWLLKSPIAQSYAHHKGVRKGLLVDFLTARHHHPTRRTQLVPWHADSNFVRIDLNKPSEPRLMTAWVPLEDCGEVRPALEFVCNVSVAQVLTFIEFIAKSDKRSFSGEELAEIIGPFESQVTAVRAGDAILFDQYLFHRTQQMGADFQDRTAIEFRLANADEVLSDPRGLLVATVERWKNQDVVRLENSSTHAFASFLPDGTPILREHL